MARFFRVCRPYPDKGRTIRVPVHMSEKIRKVLRTRNELAKELAREPTEEEIAAELGWGLDHVEDALAKMPDTTSLNQPASSQEQDSSELGDLLEDAGASDAPASVIGELEAEHLGAAIEYVSEPARHVLTRRYGLDGRAAATLKELGAELDLSRERIRQLQRKGEAEIKVGWYGHLLSNSRGV